jgi:hypothetical protein
MARREGSAGSLRSLVESASAETLTIVRFLRRLSPWRAGRDSRAAFGCEGFATRSVARNPLGRCAPTRHSLIARDSPSGSRASFARHAHRQRSWLAKKNPNPRKINDLRSSDRHIAAYRGTQDGTQHRKRHPGGTGFGHMGAPPTPDGGLTPPPDSAEKQKGACARRCATDHCAIGSNAYRAPAKNRIAYGLSTGGWSHGYKAATTLC